jgi:hypothetical protein
VTVPAAQARRRWGALALVVVAVAGLTSVFLVRALGEQQRRLVPTAATKLDRALDLGAVLNEPHIVFRSTAPGPTYGMLASVPLKHPGGRRSVSTMLCDRIYATRTSGICLAAQRGALTTYSAQLLDGRLAVRAPIPIAGIPSRARLSADGSYAATTSFISGHGYGTIGFSTQTSITGPDSAHSFDNLEKDFSTLIDGRKVTSADLNIWGVTFGPGPRPTLFYATVATGGSTWLARGDLASRTLTALREDAECPSLSPDGKTLLYKKRAGSATRWRYHVLDLKTGAEHPLAERRSVDDQAEWLDDQHVLYGLPRHNSGETDVWVVDVRATSAKPTVFMPHAWSPAVVRGPAAATGSDSGVGAGA